MEYLLPLVPRAPVVIGWLVAIIVAGILTSRGISKLFLIGSIFMFAGALLGSFIPIITMYLINSRGMSAMGAGIMVSSISLGINLIELAGIILIIVGFRKVATRKVQDEAQKAPF